MTTKNDLNVARGNAAMKYNRHIARCLVCKARSVSGFLCATGSILWRKKAKTYLRWNDFGVKKFRK